MLVARQLFPPSLVRRIVILVPPSLEVESQPVLTSANSATPNLLPVSSFGLTSVQSPLSLRITAVGEMAHPVDSLNILMKNRFLKASVETDLTVSTGCAGGIPCFSVCDELLHPTINTAKISIIAVINLFLKISLLLICLLYTSDAADE